MKITFYHTRHSCGHSVYWADPDVGMGVANWPCPWCGAETGIHVEDDMISMSGVLVARRYNPDGTFPWPDDWKKPDKIIVRHMTGDVCCDGAKQ